MQNGNFIVCDIFAKRNIEKIESKFKEYFYIEKKEVITINVKHAMNLDRQRIEKIIKSISGNTCITKLLRGFFASADGSRTYNELGKSKEYICYVLKLKSTR